MSDVLLKVGASGPARKLFKTMGLPVSLPAPLRRASGPWQSQPLAGQRIWVGAASGSQPSLRAQLQGWLIEAGVEVLVAVPEARSDALVFDAGALAAPAELRALFEVFQPAISALAASGRVVLVARQPAEATTAPAAAAQAALEGFARSLAKELGKKGATVQLVRVASGAEAQLAPLLQFLLSARSAFITGQVISLGGSPVAEPP